MVIDYGGGLPLSHAGDIKISKKSGTIEKRPVEESANSENAKFESGREDIDRKTASEQIFSPEHNEIVLYNGKGNLGDDNLSGAQGVSGEVRIDLIV